MSSLFAQELQKRVIFLDGAMGTSIHEIDLSVEEDYMGLENCTEVLVLTRPKVIQSIHEKFLEVGADGVETDTFGAMPHVLCEFDLQDRCHEINVKACQIARAACDKYSTPQRPRFVIGSVGPGTKLITLGNIKWDDLFESYKTQGLALIDGGCDVFLIETTQDILQIKCAINAFLAALEEKGKTTNDIPIMVQVTIETMGTMLAGTDIAGVVATLWDYPIISLGMNCATGPTEMTQYVKYLGQNWKGSISLLPNAGLPTLVQGRTVFPLGPEPFAEKVGEFVQKFGVNIVGGCCGTMPAHIKALVQKVGVDTKAGHIQKIKHVPSISSLYNPTDYRQENSILNIGERTNASGSRKFKRLLEEEKWDEIMSLAKDMIREGSHVIDINVDYAGRDNIKDMQTVVSMMVGQVNAPLMLDSTQPKTIEAGLKCAGGKCIINSGNLEEGEEKFAQMCKLAKKYGAGLVLGCIDEDPQEAMARTADRKLSIASRMYDLATKKYGLAGCDLMFDPLVLPISTGMEQDRESGLATIAGTKRISQKYPEVQITCGLSNISFGLKPAARQVLNSVFLSELVDNGMTSAILHVSKILPKMKIKQELWDAAIELIYNRQPPQPVTLKDGSKTQDPLQIFINLFPDDAQALSMKEDIADLPLEERLQKHIIDGEKKNLEKSLEQAMEKYSPLAIVNDHLLEGMKVVGELFGNGQMQLPFVLQSAQVMKDAVAFLESFMEKADGSTKGTMVLATVRGDVHDIGKNLVDIILTNNGYTVHNIGIKQTIQDITAAIEKYKPDALGLSGLLVKSVNIMEENLNELNQKGIDMPVLLGGAALSKHYCDSHLRKVYNGNTYHGKDAFEGLRIMNALMAGQGQTLEKEIQTRLEQRAQTDIKLAAIKARQNEKAKDLPDKSDAATDIPVPKVPFYGHRVVDSALHMKDIFPYINKIALYRGQWQFKKGKMSKEEYAHQLEDIVEPIFEKLKKQCIQEDILHPKVTYGYYPCQSQGDDLIIYDAIDHDKEIQRFDFPRQMTTKRQCISDFFKSVQSGQKDVIGLSCVTMGQKVSQVCKTLFDANDYTQYLYMHGIGVECAEALAELWHKRMRQEMGIDGEDGTSIRELFTQKYRGSRYSFGYPACPEMSHQEKLFKLIDPQRIGCFLSENWQIDPEQSTSALIVHHPQAKYFNV